METKWRQNLGHFLRALRCKAQKLGYHNEVHRAWAEVMAKPGNKEKHEKWLKFNR